MLDFAPLVTLIGVLLIVILFIVAFMWIIGTSISEDIVKKIIESHQSEIKYYYLIAPILILLGVAVCLVGLLIAGLDNAGLDNAVLVNGNFRGYSFAGLGISLLAYSFTMIQAIFNHKFSGKLLENMEEIQKNLSKEFRKFSIEQLKPSLQEYTNSKKIFKIARILLVIGILVCILGGYLTYLDNVVQKSDQFKGITWISVGFSFMAFAGAIELSVINRTVNNQIIKKVSNIASLTTKYKES